MEVEEQVLLLCCDKFILHERRITVDEECQEQRLARDRWHTKVTENAENEEQRNRRLGHNRLSQREHCQQQHKAHHLFVFTAKFCCANGKIT
ncbi:11729_t:CDS:1, partial [Gigaspora rosea]